MKNNNLTLNQVKQVASIVAAQTFGELRQEVGEVVRQELPLILKSKADSTNVHSPKYGRLYVDPPFKPSCNFTVVAFEAAKWSAVRGERLGSATLFKLSTREKLLVNQYGSECSVMLLDLSQAKTEFDKTGRPVKLGTSPLTKFHAFKGVLEDVVAMLKDKGWQLVTPVPKHQLELVNAP